MRSSWLHMSLIVVVLAQPLAGAGTWAAMMAGQLQPSTSTAEPSEGAVSGVVLSDMEMFGMEMPGMEVSDKAMPGCHSAAPESPDCCDDMDGIACGMDCGAASPALGQPTALAGAVGHGAYVANAPYAAPESPCHSPYKPPRTS